MKNLWMALMMSLCCFANAQINEVEVRLSYEHEPTQLGNVDAQACHSVNEALVLDNGLVPATSRLVASANGHLVSIEIKRLPKASSPLYVYNAAHVLYTTFMIRPKAKITTLLPKGTYWLMTSLTESLKWKLEVK